MYLLLSVTEYTGCKTYSEIASVCLSILYTNVYIFTVFILLFHIFIIFSGWLHRFHGVCGCFESCDEGQDGA